MENQYGKTQNRALASEKFSEPYLDFILSREAMMCTQRTISWYQFTLGKIISWLEDNYVDSPEKIKSRHVRGLLGEMASKGYADSYIHSYARVMKTFFRFMVQEEYISESIRIQMPKVAEKKLTVYNEVQVRQILRVCKDKRDRAFIQLMVDSGLRLSEVIALNWADVDVSNGIIRVLKGKGRKTRIVVVGVSTRRALLKYRGEVDSQDLKPLFQTITGGRFTPAGLRSWVLRIGKRAKIHVTPHALRRTFATLSLRAGMDVFQLQALMGHSSLEMTRRYVSLLDEDLIKAHKRYGPIDHLFL